MAKVILEQVSKQFGNVLAVNNVTLDIPDRQFTVLVGPSGCGKTTCLRLVAGLEEATAGNIYIGERLVNDVAPKDRDIAMVFQNYALYPHMTVYDNMAFGLRLRKYPRPEIDRRVKEAAEMLGIQELLSRKPKQLSGGQRQRVGVARALGADPPVLLMDEPFGAIDRIARERLQNEFLRIQREVKKTVVFVTHDIDEAIKLGDRIAVMNAGRLEQYDTPAAILAKPASDLVVDLLGPDRGLKRLSVTPIDPNALERPPVVHADDSLADARRLLDSRWTRVVVLDRNDKPIGELDRDLADGDGRVGDRARPLDAIIGADRTLYDAFSQMLIHQASWVAVVDGDRFRGVLTPQSFVAAIQRVPAELEGARR